MPPKRKRTVAATEDVEAPLPTRRSTRSSAVSKPKTTSSKSKDDTPLSDEEMEEDPPPKKKGRTTKKDEPKPKTTAKGRGKKSADRSRDIIPTDTHETTPAHVNGSEPVAVVSSQPNGHDAMVPMVVDEEKPAPPPPPAKIEPPKPKNTKKPEPYSASTALALFQQYADPDDPSVIGPEGMERMCTDAGIPMDGALPIILAWQVNAKELGKFEKQGWIDGMAKHKISNFTALQTLLTDLEDLLLHQKPAVRAPSGKNSEVYDRTVYRSYADNVEDAFKKFYSFGFALAKPEQSKNIDMETASALWTVMLVPRYRLMGDIVNYINDKGTYRAANKDLWAMMLEFVSTVDPDLKDYTTSEEDSWPTLIDEFVEWKKAQ